MTCHQSGLCLYDMGAPHPSVLLCLQGCLVLLSLWKSVKEDPRWSQEEGPLHPDNFYPDRSAIWVGPVGLRQCLAAV